MNILKGFLGFAISFLFQVQKQEQYRFLHECLASFISQTMTEQPIEEDYYCYSNID